MLKQPASIVKMTNIAIIRYKMSNKTFEIACYRNKALNWRNQVEKDISEVLQMQEIYQNASHGTLAKKSDLNKCFPNKTKAQIIQIILNKGQLQVSDKQRQAQQVGVVAEIVQIIVQKCVHPVTKRRFTPDTIRQAIKDIYFPIKTDQTAKKQALDCIKQLQKKYKIARAMMRVKLIIDKEHVSKIQKQLSLIDINQYQSSEQNQNSVLRVYDIEPNKYRDLTQLCKKSSNVTVEVLINTIINKQFKDLETQQFSILQLINPGVREQDNEEKKEDSKHKQQSNQKQTNKVEQKVSKCSTCGQYAIFQTSQDQRSHFKTEWHVENVKRKSKGLNVFSEQDYKIAEFNKSYQ